MDRVIVIKSNDKELNEAFMELAELFSQGFRIEGKEEPQESNKEGEYVTLHAYEELERQLDKAIEERNKLEELSRKLLIRSNKLQQFVNKFKSEASEL